MIPLKIKTAAIIVASSGLWRALATYLTEKELFNMKSVSFEKIIVLCFFVFFSSNEALSENLKEIKLAIMDNFHSQKNPNEQYGKYYKDGIGIAKYRFKKSGYKLIIKYFSYGVKPLAVLKIIPRVKKWNPDFIIGPRNSNVFLFLESSFKETLVLSPSATSNSVSNMPKNFYSLAYEDEIFAKKIVDYLKTNYPKKEMFGIVKADCKNCIDISDDFKRYYDRNHNNAPVKYAYFYKLNDQTINVQKILTEYKNGQIIFLPNDAYTSSILMPSIVNYLNKSVLFIGGDDWGSWNDTQVGKIHADYPYSGIRFTPWSLDIKTRKIEHFNNYYFKIFKKLPEDVVNYMSYNSLMSVLCAIDKYKKTSEIYQQ